MGACNWIKGNPDRANWFRCLADYVLGLEEVFSNQTAVKGHIALDSNGFSACGRDDYSGVV